MSTHRSADRSFETKSSGSRYRHMRPAPRAWLVLGTCCAVLSASAACSPAPQAGRSSSSPAVSGSPSAPPATLPGGWNAGGDLSTTRWGQMVGVLLQGGRVLVTGTSSDGRGVGNVDIYDPAGGWSVGPKLPNDRIGAVAAPLPGGRSLLAGGRPDFQGDCCPPGPLATAMTYNPSTGTWTKAPNMSVARAYATATPLPDGRVLIAGGYDAQIRPLASSQFFNPTSSTWTTGPMLTHGRFRQSAVLLKGGGVLVVGGADQENPDRLLSSAELFDPATPRSNHLAISLPNGHVLVAGGSGSRDALASSELYDPSAKGMPAAPRSPAGPGLWQLAATKPIPIDSYTGSAQLLPDGRVLLVPKFGNADLQVYDPKSDAWSTPFSRKVPPCITCTIGSPSPPEFLAAPLANGKVFLLTVDPQRAIAAKTEVIDLQTGTATLVASPGKIGQSRLELLPDGRIWVTALQQLDRHALLYNVTTDHWTTTSDVPLGLAESGADMQTVTAIPGGRVLVVGSRKAMVYDPASGGWTDAGSFPSAWSQFSATGLASGDVLIAGGTMLTGTTPEGAPTFAVNSQTMLWERTSGQVRPAASMPVGLYYHSAALLGDGRVLLAGGSDAVGMHTSADPVTRAEIYDHVARNWSLAASLPVARYQAIAVPLNDGRVFLVGGSGMWLGALLPSEGQPSLLFTPQP